MSEKYMDSYVKEFVNEDDFLQEIMEHRATQFFSLAKPSEIRAVGSSEMMGFVDEELLEDTNRHSGICLQTDDLGTVPLRECAIYALNNKTGAEAKFIKRLPLDKYIELMNEFVFPFMPNKNNNFLLFMEDNKITGIMGASTYREIPAIDVFEKTKAFMDNYFPNALFKKGYFSHENVYAQYDLSAHADDFNIVLNGTTYVPEFTMQTSDCGLSSVTFRPYISCSRYAIPIRPERVEHKGKGDKMEEIEEKLNKCYSLIDKGVSELKKLETILIDHPHTTLLRVMKDCKIPQKAGLTVAENHRPLWGPTATAFELFECICETQMLADANQTADQMFRAADDVARAAAVNWKKFDLPGDFTW